MVRPAGKYPSTRSGSVSPESLPSAEALRADHTLGTVRRWKQRTGGLAIGFMPAYVPRELLWAQGVLPVGIVGGGDDVEIIGRIGAGFSF